MTRKLGLITITSFILAVPATLLARNSDKTLSPAVMQAVEAAFPKDLKSTEASSSDEGSPGDPNVFAVVFSQKADGVPDLVIASYSGKGVEVAMLAYEHGAARIIDAVTDREFFFGGDYCNISIINLADPAHPSSLLEKTVRIAYGGRSEQDWYFVWNGTKLVNITALDNESGLDAPNSAMPDSYVVDIDHSGSLQIVGRNGDGDTFAKEEDGISASPTLTLFRYNGTTYAPAKTMLALREFTPQPSNWSESMNGSWNDATLDDIDMHHTPAPSYQLTIVNGDRDGNNRVTSAKVEINGVTIISPTEIDKGVETLTRTIQLQKENAIKVTVDGPAKSHLYVVVE